MISLSCTLGGGLEDATYMVISVVNIAMYYEGWYITIKMCYVNLLLYFLLLSHLARVLLLFNSIEPDFLRCRCQN